MTLAEALAVVASVRAHYDESIFPPPAPKADGALTVPAPGVSVDRYSAAGCRIACDLIRSRLLDGESHPIDPGAKRWMDMEGALLEAISELTSIARDPQRRVSRVRALRDRLLQLVDEIGDERCEAGLCGHEAGDGCVSGALS